MEHSRLLKYLVPGSGLVKMEETPGLKLQYEYKNPENVESEVLGEHKLRDGPSTSEDNKVEIASDTFSLSPVITVTKKEATFTKGDLKLQKISVTEDISEENGHTGEVYFRRKVRRQVSRGIMMKDDPDGDIANGRPEVNTKNADRKPTKIPKLKQTVERLREQRRSKEKKDGAKGKKEESKEKGEAEATSITYRRSSIPKLRDRKLAKSRDETTTTKDIAYQPEEDFDKLFEDLVQNRKSQIIDDFIVNTKIDDPEKVEIKFEEIVHNYEGDTQPVQPAKPRPSKIPFLKRKSEQEIQVLKPSEKSTKISSIVEHHRVRNATPVLKDGVSSISSETKETHVVTRRVTKTVTKQKLSYDSTSNQVVKENKPIVISNETPKDAVEITEMVESPIEDTEETEFKFNDNVKVRPGFSRHLRTIANTYKQHTDNDTRLKRAQIKKDTQDSAEQDIDTESKDKGSAINSNKATVDNTNNQIDELKFADKHVDNNKRSENIETYSASEALISKHKTVTETTTITESNSNGIVINILNANKVENVETNKETVTDDTQEPKSINNKADDEKRELNEDSALLDNLKTKVIQGKSTETITEINGVIKDITFDVNGTENIYEIKSDKDSEHSEQRESNNLTTVINDDDKRKLVKSLSQEDAESNDRRKKEIGEDAKVEELIAVKGKVGRIINQIEILPSEVTRKEILHEMPKKKSVLSRIAMFERQEMNEPMPQTKVFHTRTKVNKITKEFPFDNTSDDVARKPVIVHEILKEKKVYTNEINNQIPIKAYDDTVEEIKAVEEILEVLDRELEANDNSTITQATLDSEIRINKIDIPSNSLPDVPVIIPRPASIILEETLLKENGFKEHENKYEIPKVIGEILKSNQMTQESYADEDKPYMDIDINEARYVIESFDDVITLPRELNRAPVYERVISSNATEDKLRNVDIPALAITKDYVKHASSIYERNLNSRTVDNRVQTSSIANMNDRLLDITVTKEFEPSHEQNTAENAETDVKEFSFAKTRTAYSTQFEERIQRTMEFTRESTEKVDPKSKLDKNQIRLSYSVTDWAKDFAQNDVRTKAENIVGDIEEDLNAEDNLKRLTKLEKERELSRAKSLAELDLGDSVRGQVNRLIVRMKSTDNVNVEKREVISVKERPRKQSVLEKIALFERKISPAKMDTAISDRPQVQTTRAAVKSHVPDEELRVRVAELTSAKLHFGRVSQMPTMTLRNGVEMPILALGTSLLDPKLTSSVIGAAIDLGYRAFDTAFIYGNEQEVGAGIRAKINDGTVRREELFIISKLWSSFHRQDLVEVACSASLKTMGLTYFDLYLIHNPMSFKEGSDPIPKIATVVQYSTADFMDAWYGMEQLVSKGLVKSIGVSNFNSHQIARVVEKGKVKPTVNQVECHLYLSQQRLDAFCSQLGVKLSCFGVLGSKGTPLEYKSTLTAAIDDPLVVVMASGLNVTPAQLLIRYQIQAGHSVVVKSSSAAHLWDNLQALNINLSPAQMEGLHALNRNKRTFTFKGMGDTHKNYPFSAAF